ncbi:ubinuclein-1 isoform X3 [Xenopus tropicalis]|uniref:Ubinuclein-1 isoform X3 n=1 Tax=Xenopus tropicalis TaxID=8364 RepID=A0A8J1ISW9_XENTR|nr:ubinuclein-1 isoform X3 [Xenopus tropicalis]
MAEPRRMQLTCLPPTNPPNSSAVKRQRSEEQESETPAAATVRIALTLFEPDQKRCPEFCYPELLRNLRGDSRKSLHGEKSQKKVLNILSEEEAERKEVANIARRFEEKYGNKKRRRDRMQDLIDMGYGYDESDSFIDNSEAYDELVPASLSTKYGGFYINSGTLQFRQASESEDEASKEKKKKSPKVKLTLQAFFPVASINDLFFVLLLPPQKIKDRGEKVKKKKRAEDKKSKKNKHPKPGFTALNGTKDKKKKKHSIFKMLARFEQEKNAQKTIITPPTPTPTVKPSGISQQPTLPKPTPREAELTPDPTMSSHVSELLKAVSAIDSISEKPIENVPNTLPEKKHGVQGGTASEQATKAPASLPEGLPFALEKRIKELTKAVRASEGEKKGLLFSQEMNSALLDIYLLSRELSSSLRLAVFSHLASVLPCGKDTLGGRLREPLRKLKEAVARAMPEQISKYHEECKVYNQAKYAKLLEEDKEREQKAGSAEEEEGEKGGRKSSGPRKKFQWTDEIRQLLSQLVRTKVDMFEQEENGVPSLEDYLKSFLDGEVKPLWPRGWMQASTLFKESRRGYPQLSSILAKNRAMTAQKVKIKDSSNKNEKKPALPPKEAATDTVATSVSSKDMVSSSGPPPVVASSLSSYTQDNSLDGDLIHNPPSLDTVSEHLTALSSRPPAACLDFPSPRICLPEKPVEEKKKPSPPISVQLPRGASTDQPVTSEKKVVAPSHTAKPSSDVQQGKQKPHLNAQVKTLQIARPSMQPSVKLYQISNQHSKVNLVHPVQNGSPRVPVLSPPQRPFTKPAIVQGYHPPSPLNNLTRPAVPPSSVGKLAGNAGTTIQQVYRPPVPRNPVPPSSSSGSSSIPNLSPNSSLNPSISNASRNSSTLPTKKPPHPPQKLTLMAPQDSGVGTQGVAKLLTSSMVTGVGTGTSASSTIAQPPKCSPVPTILTSTPSLTVLTPAYKPNGGKLPGPTQLSLLSPISTFPLHVISFSTDPVPKAAASKDAIVTGPAPGTFHHGLARNVLGALHSSAAHHSSQLPRPSLANHIQPGQTDGAHIHGKGPAAPQKKL